MLNGVRAEGDATALVSLASRRRRAGFGFTAVVQDGLREQPCVVGLEFIGVQEHSIDSLARTETRSARNGQLASGPPSLSFCLLEGMSDGAGASLDAVP